MKHAGTAPVVTLGLLGPSVAGTPSEWVDFRDPKAAKRWVAEMTARAVAKGMNREVVRQQLRDFAKSRAHEDPNKPHQLMSSQVEALAAMRGMDRPASVDPMADEIEQRRKKNARKRARRARR